MGVAERREREKLELRQQILDAARELFVAEGYDAVTMRKIADAIEYSPTAIYLHFRDKDELIRELCRADFLALAKEFQKIAEIRDPLARLRQSGRAYIEFGISHPNHYRLMFMTPHPNHPVEESEQERMGKGNPEEDAYAFLKMTVTECVAAGLFRPQFADVELVSQILWAGVHGAVSLRIAMTKETWVDWRPLPVLAEGLIETQLRGLLREREGK